MSDSEILKWLEQKQDRLEVLCYRNGYLAGFNDAKEAALEQAFKIDVKISNYTAPTSNQFVQGASSCSYDYKIAIQALQPKEGEV